MITKAQVKHIRSLEDKKIRSINRQFVVEGSKMVNELLQSGFEILEIYATEKWIENHKSKIEKLNVQATTESYLSAISQFKTPNEVVALAKIPDNTQFPQIDIAIALDNLQDPGNLGTIIRIADWYGVKYILCNENTVDCFNHKVIQASMGSIFRVQCHYINLIDFFQKNKKINKYACVLNGDDVNKMDKLISGIIVIGNESKGIHNELLDLCNFKITIPKKGLAESLNAAVATGIICNTLL